MDTALITGASSGIGREYARLLAQRGYRLLLVGNRAEQNQSVAEALQHDYGVEVLTLCVDLSQPHAAQQVFDWCEQRHDRVDLLICNAGMLLFSQLVHTPPEQLTTITHLHCLTPMLLARLFGAKMAARGNGRILFTASATAWMPYPTIAHYAATKVFLKNLTQALAHEMRRHGVCVTAVYPGAVDTPLYSLDEKIRRRLLRLGVMSTPEQVASCGLKALFRGRSRAIPGLFTRLCVALCCLAPDALIRALLRIPAVGRILDRV